MCVCAFSVLLVPRLPPALPSDPFLSAGDNNSSIHHRVVVESGKVTQQQFKPDRPTEGQKRESKGHFQCTESSMPTGIVVIVFPACWRWL
uniref:Putative secreted protein n=1 Tax=Anopheles darlingi TaxID=43151 RepID=A0A2M4DQZ0_ANODA